MTTPDTGGTVGHRSRWNPETFDLYQSRAPLFLYFCRSDISLGQNKTKTSGLSRNEVPKPDMLEGEELHPPGRWCPGSVAPPSESSTTETPGLGLLSPPSSVSGRYRV